MKRTTSTIGILIVGFFLLFGCKASTSVDKENMDATHALFQMDGKVSNGVAEDMYRSTGELSAQWVGCEDGGHEPGGCEGETEAFENIYDDCIEDIAIFQHDDGGCQGARPAREFYLEYNAHLIREKAKGRVLFQGTGNYQGIDFNGKVSWVVIGRETNELFFGGKVINGTVNRGCFLFSVQDNGEGVRDEMDRMQYRLYGSGQSPCHIPNHLPIGYPIAVHDGNLQVH